MNARAVIRTLVALEPAVLEPYSRISNFQGEFIASLFEGDFTLFAELDERPGAYTSPYYHGIDGHHRYNDWHWKLRQARNNCPRFFDILNRKVNTS